MTSVTAELAYRSDSALETAWVRRGWDAFDRMVLWAVEQRGAGSLESIAQILPAGIAYRVIGLSVQHLVADGLVERRVVAADPSGPVVAIGSVRTVYVLAEQATVPAMREAA